MPFRFLGLPAALVLVSVTLGVGCGEPASSGQGSGGTNSGGSAGSGPMGSSSSGGADGGGGSSAGTAGTEASGSGGSAGSAAPGGAGGGGNTCSEAGGAGGTSAVTRISESCPLSSLSEAQVEKLCADTGAYVASAISKASACKYAALVTAASSSSPTVEELQAACSSEESACNEDATSMGPGVLCTEIPETCTATVAQYTSCISDETMAFEQGVVELVSCSTLTFESISAIYEVPDVASQAASCKALATACPGFFPPYIN